MDTKHGSFNTVMETEEVSVSVRFPADLRDALRALAKRENRSMNAQVVYLLRQAVRQMGTEVSDTPVPNVPGRGQKKEQ